MKTRPTLTFPTPRGGRFRIYFDGTPKPHDWKALGKVIEELAKLTMHKCTIAGVSMEFDTEEQMTNVMARFAGLFAGKADPKTGEPLLDDSEDSP